MMIDLKLWRRLLVLAGPLILTTTAHMLMQFIDGLFLARYSSEAIAAIGPASMAAFCLGSLVSGAVGYTSVLSAHYFGAGRREQIGPAVWQGIWLSLFAGAAVAALGVIGTPLFAMVGHAPLVRQYEGQYFSIICSGMVAGFLGTAVSGFFTGRGVTKPVMYIQVTAVAVNTLLAYGLVFGRLGLPEWGVRGAAWAVFLFFVGRIGTVELAATSIAWRINGVAFFPIIGLSEAVRILVGQSQGRIDPARSAHAAWQGLLLSEVWMLITAALFVLFPRGWYALFQGVGTAVTPIADMGVVLLRFVAVYSLLDAANVVVCGVLVAAGDTRWTLWASLAGNGVFVTLLFAADFLKLGLYAEWALATVFVMAIALVWIVRFKSGRWQNIRVIHDADLHAGQVE